MMKIAKPIACCLASLLVTLLAQAQGNFQNLNFEEATPGPPITGPDGPVYQPVGLAVPHWIVIIDGVQQTQISYNDITLGAPSIDLIGSGNNVGIAPIDGNYSILLQAFAPGDTASISQTGPILSGMQSLLFEAQPEAGPNGVLELQVGTQVVPISAVGSGPNFTLYGANISAWAGDSEQITFSTAGGATSDNWEIDDISFSQTAIPEPSIVALTALGGLFFGGRKWFTGRG